MSNLDINLHHTRAEIQGTCQLLFAEGAASVAAARKAGLLDYGNFLGLEIKTEPKHEPVMKAVRGVVLETGSTPGVITFGVELTTRELADARKVKHLLSAKTGSDLAQLAINNAAIDVLDFGAGVDQAVLNQWYELTKTGVVVRELSAVSLAVAGGGVLVEGTDYILDKKVGLVRFINAGTLPAADVTPTVTAPAIDAAHAGAMTAFVPMQQSYWRGYARILVWDQDARNNLVKDFELRPVEISLSSTSTTIDHEKQSELKLLVKFTDNATRVLVRN